MVRNYTTAEHRNLAEMDEPSSSGHALIGMASAVAQDGQAAGRDGRKGGARPARVGGPLMAFMYMYRFFRTFCVHVLAASRVCLVRRLAYGSVCGMWTVTFYERLSWRVCRTRRESSLR